MYVDSDDLLVVMDGEDLVAKSSLLNALKDGE